MNILLVQVTRFTAQAFVSGLWQGVVFLLAVAAALRFLPRLTAAARFAIWSAAFLAIAAIPLIHLHTPSPVQATPAIHLDLRWALAIAAFWAILLTLRLTRLAIHALRLRRIWRRATPISTTPRLQSILDNAARRPALCSSSDVDAPSVIGFFAPRILVPETLLPSLTESELHQIVQHECEHLRRRDDWINLFQKLALAIFPLNPALLVIDYRLGLERELACDAAVIHSFANPFAYANALTRLAEHRILRRPLTLALSAWNRQSELARRVHRLLSPTRSMSPLQARGSLALLSLALTGGAFELAHTPHLISFAPDVAAPLAQASPISLPTEHIRAVSVVYHPAVQLLTQPLKLHAAPTHSRTRLRKAKPSPINRDAVARIAPPQPRLMLTSAPERGRQNTFRTIQAVWTDFSPTYAAIPVADGWLIIQL